MKKLLVKNIGLLATPEGKSAHRGEEQGKIKFLKDAWVLIEDGIIASVGTGAVPAVEGAEVVDAEGHLVTPGLVDAHTHLIFGGWRQNELGLKLHGASYLDIQNAGGGIQSTTNATRQASEQELAAKASKALDEMMGFGTTTVEAKSGYGLATEHELKALEVIKDLNDHHRMDLVATFMGAHLVPAEYKSNREEYVRLVCEEMMPKVKEQGIAKFCDVFCEADTFTVEESRQVLEAGLKYGLRPKIHADEIEAIGGSQLAGEIGAISAEHLIVCPPEGIASMAKGGVIACLLPATSFNLGAVFAPARDMVKAGVPRCNGDGLQPRLLPVPEHAVCHQPRLPQVQADAGGGPHGCHAQWRRGDRPCRQGRLCRRGQAGRPCHLGRARPRLHLLPRWQQSCKNRHQARRDRVRER